MRPAQRNALRYAFDYKEEAKRTTTSWRPQVDNYAYLLMANY